MTKLIINADDFGYSKAINYGIIDSFSAGILTSTTLMANMPGFEHAVQLSKAFGKLAIGAHLNLTCGSPIMTKRNSSITHNGVFLSRDKLKQQIEQIDLEEVYKEWDAQISKIYQQKIALTHLDSHHYIHSFGPLYKVIELLAEKYHLPIRNCFGVKEKLTNKSLAPADELWNPFNCKPIKQMAALDESSHNELLTALIDSSRSYLSCHVIEAVCHPGYMDESIWFGSNFNLPRIREVAILCDKQFKQKLLELGFIFCNYNEV